MPEHTPDTYDVRETWSNEACSCDAEGCESFADRYAQFDRWFAPYAEAFAAVQRVRELANWHKTHSHNANCDRGCVYAGFVGNQILRALEGESNE